MAKEEKKKDNINYRGVWEMIAPSYFSRKFFILALVPVALLSAVFGIGEPFIYGNIIDRLVTSVENNFDVSQTVDSVFPLLIIWAALVVLATIVSAIYSFFSWKLANLVLAHFIRRLFDRLLGMDMKVFEEEHSGDLLEKFNRAWDAVWWITEFGIHQVMGMTFVFFGAVGFGFYIDWRLGLVALIPIPFVFIVSFFNLRLSEKHQNVNRKFWERIGAHVGDSFANVTTVKNAAAEERSVTKLMRYYFQAYKNQMRIDKGWAVVDATQGGVYVGGRLLLFVSGVYLVASGATTIGVVVMFLGLAGRYYGSVQQILAQAPHGLESMSSLNRLLRLWNSIPVIQEAEKPISMKKVSGDIVFDDVSFTYKQGQKHVLRDISYHIKPGQTIALVGSSGAGKSTLAKMLPRFYDPTEGAILLDGVDMRQISLKDLRRNIGFVMQENLLFHDTIFKNIAFVRPGASKRAVVQAAKRAQVHDFIMSTPQGYGTQVGERGVKLSGGQKQRIALARILLADPPVLVLDEATSALDSKTEHDLQAALLEVFKDRTTIVIAHRLSTVIHADVILVMEKGRIVDMGKHNQLIKKPGLYKEYWQIQAGGYV